MCSVGNGSVADFGVGSVATFGVGSAAGSAAFSGVGPRAGILSKPLIANNLLLKLLRTFSPSLNDNPKLCKKRLFFQVFLYLFQK